MAKLSRFQNLEHERPARSEPAHAPLERFSEGAGAPRAETSAPAPSPVAQRFAPDTTTDLRLAQDDLSRLPSLECGACGTENGKFDVACRMCGARMDTEATHARNLTRLAAFTETHAREQAQVELRRAAELEQATALKAEQRRQAETMAREIAEEYREGYQRPLPGAARPVKGSTVALAGLVLVVVISHSLPLSLLASLGALALIAGKLGLLGKRDWF